MLRKIWGARRGADEQWHEYVQRATHEAEDYARQLGYESWELLQRKRKWRFAGKIAQSRDQRWSKKLLGWRPWFRSIPWRGVGHPCTKWEDDLIQLAGSGWVAMARDSALWGALEAGYVNML